MKDVLDFINLLVLNELQILLITLPKYFFSLVCCALSVIWIGCITIPLYAICGCDVKESIADLFKELDIKR